MTWLEIIKDALISFVSALIGAASALYCVRLTIKDQHQKDEEHRTQSVKPYFYETFVDNDQIDMRIQMVCENLNETKDQYIVIRNTDNGVLLIDSLKSSNNIYYPLYCNVIGKNSNAILIFRLDKNEPFEETVLNVSDVLGNKYRYQIVKKKDFGYSMPEFGIKEIF